MKRIPGFRRLVRRQPQQVNSSTTARKRRDGGYTLIEAVITVTLVSVVVLPIMESVRTAIVASQVADDLAEVGTAMVNAADRVNRAPRKCDYTIYAQAAVQSQGWAANSATLTHEHYVPGATSADPGSWVPGACDGAQPSDLLVQLVTITITSPDGRVEQSRQVVKSEI